LALYPHIFKELKYKPLEDFIPVTTIFQNPAVLVVGQKVPADVRTVADFVSWCRANPGQSAYGTPGAGSPMHLLGSGLAKTAGFELVHVPYQGSGPAIQDVLGGQIASAITNLPSVVQYLETGRLRVLATTGPERSSLLSNVPTMKEAGYPALEFSEWFGFLLPARTPATIANALNTVLLEALKSEEIKSGLAKLSLEPSAISLNDFAQRLRADTQKWELLVKTSGFTGE
jgi:tripartite-type tricarboxylate transporter receptor subunit TctC